ncbi:MurNAc alpha-1-phosphate uridylyltransferase [Sphingomonas jejuensis]|jgi:N-acetyl-alpha-D-muramate 1-phosphate uridylyltransferase|uniref:MurNAc alpha-1-phosphate uridylyltransferase n=1 Tax=Sphingomonas jejuensis TaxID=904715 RepID=A0ABX0XJL5_9SPHN|nr:nucleotidyltransferase family protein [Sphingomonas jejuensis]NJC33424.1 MurNAc alpha-1-phosphate uridylyltransferase [Sphingomonas jejuensis]
MSVSKPMSIRPAEGRDPPETAMVLAAGLGKRMRPLTATRPKPLVEVAGQPLLDHVFDRLKAAGVKRAVVNVHYLADALEAHLRRHVSGIDVTVSDERQALLETGGGVAKALPLIGQSPFLVVNSDNLWIDGPSDTLRMLAGRWDDATMDALLLLVPLARANCHRGQGDFHMDPRGRLTRRRPGRVAPFVFTGIQIMSDRLLADAPGGAFSLNPMWDRAMAAGRLWGLVHQGLWFDVGTPPAIRQTETVLVNG